MQIRSVTFSVQNRKVINNVYSAELWANVVGSWQVTLMDVYINLNTSALNGSAFNGLSPFRTGCTIKCSSLFGHTSGLVPKQ